MEGTKELMNAEKNFNELRLCYDVVCGNRDDDRSLVRDSLKSNKKCKR